MSGTQGLERVADLLALSAAHPEGFAESYGKNAVAFLEPLPWIFRLMRRIAFDLDIPQGPRHMAGIAALYIAEHQDFLGDDRLDTHGLVDDVWVAHRALTAIADTVPLERLQRHWKGDLDLEQVLGIAENLAHMTSQLPSKVEERASAYLGLHR